VSVQGYLAMDIIRKTNLELIKGVNRASTTTVAALRTAVMTAQALGVQGMVLKQITALNETTADMIVATSELMREQSVATYTQAASPVVPVEKLQIAFDNTFATFDMIADFKVKALDSMQKSVDALTIQVDRAKKYTDRAHSETLKDVSSDLAPSGNIARI
jgi:uncharacterized protein YaaN involved in tellurite resistance